MQHLMRIILLATALLGSASASADNLGTVTADCRTGGMTTTTLDGAVGDTFVINTKNARCGLTPPGDFTWSVVPIQPIGSGNGVNPAATVTVTIGAVGNNQVFEALQNGNGARVIVNAKGNQTITFPSQTVKQTTYSPGGTFPIAPLATSARPNSGNAITYSSLTPRICSVDGTTVTMLQPGTCTLAADQLGSDTYLKARPVTQDVVLMQPVNTPTAVPTLGEWSLMLLGLLAAGLGVRGLRQRPQA